MPLTTDPPGPLSRKRRRHDPNDYKIACFCVLDIEVTALRGMLDEIHDDIPTNRGQNAYILGQLSGHNVVIPVLPDAGNNNSGVVAAQVRNDFPSIQYGLLVGVGGGVPGVNGANDIRLGDVVVGEATSTSPAVVQFDRGKFRDGDNFEVTNYVNKTPPLLSATIKKLKAQHQQEGSHILPLVEDLLQRHPNMRSKYSCPGAQQDLLFNPSYEHIGGMTCEQCDKHMLIERSARLTIKPNIHYGTIGSSNKVMRSARERDRLARAHKILCVEMEAAGLLDQLPCLVIRGVCDYADNHKNKQWQPYAAAVAAAYSKELLRAIPPDDLNWQASAHDVARIQVRPIAGIDHSNLVQANVPHTDSKASALIESLTFRRMDARLRDVPAALPQTCKWLTGHPTFDEWNDASKMSQHHGFLWIKGKPGSGKSTLMKTLLARERKRMSRQIVISYFFNARAPGDLEKSSLGLYRSLLHQLLTACPALQTCFIDQFCSKERDGVVDEWTANELKDFFIEVTSDHLSKPLVILIDALDEGPEDDIRQLVGFLENLASTALQSDQYLKICLSSRHFPFISIRHSVSLTVENEGGHSQDIRKYVEQKLADDGSSAMEELRDTICRMSSNIFLWIVLVIQILSKAYDDGDKLTVTSMSSCLESLPKELDGLFSRILAQSSEGLEDCVTTLQWVLFSQAPLGLDELYAGVSLVSISPKFHVNDASPERIRRCILNASRGLVEVTKSSPPSIQFIHETVREFLLKGGFAQMDPSLSNNAGGLSNEKLRKCCFDYIENRDINLSVDLKMRKGINVEAVRREMRSKNSLLEYAAKFMFRHADIADGYNISQRDFLAQLTYADLQKWIAARNVFESAAVNRYGTDAPLLYIMAEQGYANLLVVLLENGQRDRESKEKYGTALQAACAKEHEQEARDLIAYTSHDNLGGGQYRHALFAAIHRGSPSLVDLLLDNGCKPSIDKIPSQMFRCLSDGNLKGVKVLLKLGCPIDCCKKSEGETLLIHACSQRKHSERMVDIVQLLLDAGAGVSAQGGHYGNALQAASKHGHTEIVQTLLRAGADVNARGGHYANALQAASEHGHAEVVQLLLEAGADVNAQGGQYRNALQCASSASSACLEVVQLLLAAGADVNAQGGHYGNALQAASYNGCLEVVQLLLAAGADVNAQGGHYRNALQAASYSGCLEVVQLLLAAGVDVNAQGGDYGNALQATSYNGCLEVVQLLLAAGVDVNAQGGHFGNALQAASYSGCLKVVQLLLAAGVDVNAQGGDYGNALQATSYNGSLEVVRCLLEAGADVNAQGGFYKNALQAACSPWNYVFGNHHRDRLVQILIEHGAHDTNPS